MIRAVFGRGALGLAFILAVLSVWVPAAIAGVIVLTGIAFIFCCTSQKAVWTDGWHAAHEHHNITDGHLHLMDYVRMLRHSEVP